jgi:ParB-like chromosome segregation protein Spo0J
MGEDNLHWKVMETRLGSVGNIHVVDRIMPPTKARIDAMAKSLSSPLGQLLAILVTKYLHSAWRVVCGATRLQAAKELGWKEINATIISAGNETEYQLIEIAENLDRHNLSKAECARLKSKNKELRAQRLEQFKRELAEKESEAKGGRGRAGGVRDAARKAGVSETTARRKLRQNDEWRSLANPKQPDSEPPKHSEFSTCGNDSMSNTDKEGLKARLKARLNEIDSEIEQLRNERESVVDRLDDIVDEEEKSR